MLESVIYQVTSECEIVVRDAASADDTERVVSEYAKRFANLRYIKKSDNGIDRNFDDAVQLARGEYCWLMSDDDVLKPGALAAVLDAVRRGYSLVVVNSELVDTCDMTKVLQPHGVDIVSDRVYRPEELDRLCLEAGNYLRYIGSVVIKREIWIARNRERYYGTCWTHVGVIFQKQLPGEALVLARPFIKLRMGNEQTWKPRAMEIFMFHWPDLIYSTSVSESVKRKMCAAEPWKKSRDLLLWRGLGAYSLHDYRRLIHPRLRSRREGLSPILICLLPRVLANALSIVYFLVAAHDLQPIDRRLLIHSLRASRYNLQRIAP